MIATGILNALVYALFHIKDILVRKTLTVVYILILLVAAITYGLWQSWWLGEFVFILGMGAFMSNMRINTAAKDVAKKAKNH